MDQRKIQDSDSPLPNDQHNSIEEIMVYYVNSQPVPLIVELRALGYDVVIVNHPVYERGTKTIDGGADYIERNAMNHVKLYQDLNAEVFQNGSSEQLVIVGPSMGGQISRYALAYMEDNNIAHNTRLWVSVDSPHLGANIPIGAQALINLANDYSDSAAAQDFVDDWLGSNAAKQQLIEQHKLSYVFGSIPSQNLSHDYLDGKTISQGFTETRGHPFFTQYYNKMFTNGLNNSKGYPQNLRKIAIVNGSLAGTREFENPYLSGSTDLSGTTFTDDYPYSTAKVLKLEGDANVIGHIATLEAYFMAPYGSNHKSAYFKEKKFGGWNYHHRYLNNINSRGNMDNIPGGWYPTQRDLAHEIIQSTPCKWVVLGNICVNDWNIDNLDHVSSFIPTVSALGFKNPNFNWYQKLDRNLVCSNEIPFDSYFGPKVNERHTSFTEESVNWLLKELSGNPQDPYFPVDSDKLVGSPQVCNAETYIFQNCSTPGAVQNWEVSYNLQIVNSDSNSITVDLFSSSASGDGWIKATFANGNIVQKEIMVSTPYIDNITFGNGIYEEGYFCSSHTGNTYELYPKISGNLYQIRLLSFPSLNVVFTSSFSSSASGTIHYTPVPGWYVFEARMQNTCGTSEWTGFEVEYVDCSNNNGGGEHKYIVYPNPSSSIINISYKNTASEFATKNDDITQLRLYDFYSKVLIQKSGANLKELNISTLNDGIYYLEITSNDKIEVHKVVFKK